MILQLSLIESVSHTDNQIPKTQILVHLFSFLGSEGKVMAQWPPLGTIVSAP